MIAIFDYGAGNLRSVENTLAEVGAAYTLVRDAAGLRAASKIILPGVGHFGQIMRALDEMGVRAARWASESPPECRSSGSVSACTRCSTAAKKRPKCEAWVWCTGTVRRFPETARVPHMGWNNLEPRQAVPAAGWREAAARTSTSPTATMRR